MVAPESMNVNGVIHRLDILRDTEVGEENIVIDAELNRLLDALRPTYPMPYKCQAPRCSHTLAYWALHSSGARIAPGPARVERAANPAGKGLTLLPYRPGEPPRVQETIIGGVAALRFPELVFEGRFEEPVEWAISGQGNITLETNPEVGSPWPLRWGFRCARCGTPRKHTNGQMLRYFLDAIEQGASAIRPE